MNSEISKVRKKGQGRTHILACLDLRLYVGTPVLHLLKQRCISSASDHRSNQIPKSKVLYFLNSFVLSPQLINCRSPNLHLVGQSIRTCFSFWILSSNSACDEVSSCNTTEAQGSTQLAQNSAPVAAKNPVALRPLNHLDSPVQLLEPRQSLQVKNQNAMSTSQLGGA